MFGNYGNVKKKYFLQNIKCPYYFFQAFFKKIYFLGWTSSLFSLYKLYKLKYLKLFNFMYILFNIYGIVNKKVRIYWKIRVSLLFFPTLYIRVAPFVWRKIKVPMIPSQMKIYFILRYHFSKFSSWCYPFVS